VNLRFACGPLGSVEVSRTARYSSDTQSEVLGSDGAVRVGPSARRRVAEMQLLPRLAAEDERTPPFGRRFAEAYRAQIEDFFQCVPHGRAPRAGGEDALAAIEIVGGGERVGKVRAAANR
jgi:myo-inositol 2-dehydrogenase/D-chiro-inositol 1-dehydrogenase